MKKLSSLLVLMVIFIIAGCATYPPTRIDLLPERPNYSLPLNTVEVLASLNYLNKLDSIEGSEKSKYDADQGLANAVVEAAIKNLPSPTALYISNTETANKSRFRCDITIHSFVAYRTILYVILPTPWSVNESCCVTATLTDKKNNKIVSKYEEWGYNKQTGFWAFYESAQEPTNQDLRRYLVEKVIENVAADAARLNK